MIITALRRSPRAPDAYVVYADGARVASLPGPVVRDLKLAVGRELDDRTRQRFEDAVEGERAYGRAVRLLTARPRAGYELAQRLRAKGFSPPAAQSAVGRLEAEGYLDDARFAEDFARRSVERGHAPRRILAELRRRGVDGRVAERAIASSVDTSEEALRSRAEALARRRASQLRGLPPQARVRRIVGYLGRRGFSGGDVVALVRRVVLGR